MSKLSLAVERTAPRRIPADAETAIARLAQADRALAEAIEVADAVSLVGTAKALAEWASAVKAGKDHERQSAVFVLRAIRNAGERIAQAQARGEVAMPGHPNVGNGDISPATLAEIGVTRDESSEWKRLAAQYPTDEALAEAAEALPTPSLAGAFRLAGMMTSDSPEWYTPTHIVEAAAATLGGIDLDPCAESAKAVPAAAHYTADDNGLEQGWRGTVYMNPPYGDGISDWCAKLADEYRYGNVTAAVALLPARTDTGWWKHLAPDRVCFITGRLRFSAQGPAPFPSAVVYLGPDPERFATAFGPLGLLYELMEAAA